ncbi:uncharacterized protein LOC144580565 [Callithrix jacchus]
MLVGPDSRNRSHLRAHSGRPPWSTAVTDPCQSHPPFSLQEWVLGGFSLGVFHILQTGRHRLALFSQGGLAEISRSKHLALPRRHLPGATPRWTQGPPPPAPRPSPAPPPRGGDIPAAQGLRSRRLIPEGGGDPLPHPADPNPTPARLRAPPPTPLRRSRRAFRKPRPHLGPPLGPAPKTGSPRRKSLRLPAGRMTKFGRATRAVCLLWRTRGPRTWPAQGPPCLGGTGAAGRGREGARSPRGPPGSVPPPGSSLPFALQGVRPGSGLQHAQGETEAQREARPAPVPEPGGWSQTRAKAGLPSLAWTKLTHAPQGRGAGGAQLHLLSTRCLPGGVPYVCVSLQSCWGGVRSDPSHPNCRFF